MPSLSDAVADSVMLAGGVKVAPLVGEVNVTAGALFAMAVIAGEVVLVFWLSVALAVMLYVPDETPLQVKFHGAAVTVPIRAAPLKNSTLASVPSLSAALVTKVKLAGVVTTVLVAGDVMLIVGGAFATTVMVTVFEVLLRAALSVTLAVYVVVPAVSPVSVNA